MKRLRSKKFCQDSRGFSLIEVLVALFILFALVFPLLYLFYQGWFTTTDSAEKTKAVNLAQERMEEIISEKYVEQTYEEEDIGGYTRVVEVKPDPENESMKLVTVTVEYHVGDQEREVSVSTLLPGGS